MLNLRIDPWDPGFGGSVEIEEPDQTTSEVRLDVEGDSWSPVPPTAAGENLRIAFIDGVRRVESRLFAETQGTSVPALAGSWAVGAAWGTRPPCIDNVRVGRELIVGGGLPPEDLEARIGGQTLRFVGSSTPDAGLLAPLHHLQYHMREAEAALAREIFRDGRADLLVLDGPLHYYAANGPVLGFIKRQNRAYLPPDRTSILQSLAPGHRTPLFGIGDRGKERYSWYTRIAAGRAIDGFMTGIVRVEVSAEIGAQQAADLASTASGRFPRYASHAWHDPRAPQNLYPVGQLESLLKHRLGDALLVRRAIEQRLWRTSHA